MNKSSLAVIRWVALGSSLTALGCNDKSICGYDEDCPRLDADATTVDAKLSWDSASTLDATLQGTTSSARVLGGGAVFTPEDPSCSVDCEYTLKSLYFELERISFQTGGPSARVIDALRIGLDPESSVALPAAAGGYVLPEGTKTRGCASVDGEPLSSESTLENSAALVIDPASETFTFEGELRFEFGTIPNRECVDYELVLSGSASAAAPWTQRPGVD